jgi:hypothetical protein
LGELSIDFDNIISNQRCVPCLATLVRASSHQKIEQRANPLRMIVNGKILMEDRVVLALDEEKVIEEAEKTINKVIETNA